jgi:hypothetical protein
MTISGVLLKEALGWAAARQWRFRCLLCPPGQGEMLAQNHPDLNRIHDHLVQAHDVSFDAFFHCTHEHADDGRIRWRLPDGRLWLEVTPRPDE